jgi:hypothetical protein
MYSRTGKDDTQYTRAHALFMQDSYGKNRDINYKYLTFTFCHGNNGYANVHQVSGISNVLELISHPLS